MRTRLMKPVLFGTLAVVISAIVAGPAFGRVFTPNTSQNQGSPPSQHVQQTFVPGYTDFPNVQRLQDETTPSIPGNGVFPDLQRLRSSLTPAERQQLDAVATAAGSVDQQQGSGSFVPGYTDFPNVLRYHNTLTPTERRQLDDAVASTSTASSSGGSGVNWDDAGMGIGIALAIAGGLVILAIVGMRRDKATPAPA